LAVLGPVTKAVVNRARPVVASPVVETPSNAGFPSGHAMTAVVVWGALLLVALPGVRRGARPWLVAATAVLVVAVGLTRLALGVHFVSDVLAGWVLGAAWLAGTVAVFRAWQHDGGLDADEPLDPLDVPPAEAPRLAPSPGPVLPGGRPALLRLAGAAAGISLAGIGLGLLVTAVLTDTWLGRLDRGTVRAVAELRSPGLTAVMELVSSLAGTRTVIAVGLALAVLALAITSQLAAGHVRRGCPGRRGDDLLRHVPGRRPVPPGRGRPDLRTAQRRELALGARYGRGRPLRRVRRAADRPQGLPVAVGGAGGTGVARPGRGGQPGLRGGSLSDRCPGRTGPRRRVGLRVRPDAADRCR
jgi:hypothetical protein